MILSDDFSHFHPILKFCALAFKVFEKFGNILDSFKLKIFWTHGKKAMTKDKNVNHRYIVQGPVL
jgi:hypothetical protein